MVDIYLVRHGLTMFNTIHRAQGWSDTPLTQAGEVGIQELGLAFKEKSIRFDRAYSSDSGRTIQTMGLILKFSDNEGIPYKMDPRIREWSFGSFDGGYEGDLFEGVLPRIFLEKTLSEEPTYEEIANAIYRVDTAGWAQTWEVLRDRILTGITEIAQEAEKEEAKNIVIVSHGLTIGTFINEKHPKHPRIHGLDNGSVTKIKFDSGQWIFDKIGDMSYRTLGKEIMQEGRGRI